MGNLMLSDSSSAPRWEDMGQGKNLGDQVASQLHQHRNVL